MRLFHGSIEVVDHPLIMDSQRLLDFGKGFYTTTNQKQAEKWALIKQKRNGNNTTAIVSVYNIREDILTNKKFNIKIFTKACEQWLDFIISNRRGVINHNYDIVKGPVANDTLYTTIVLFESGILTKKETIMRLKAHKLFDQLSFHNQEILKELKFLKSMLT